jgi:hypothetical protein
MMMIAMISSRLWKMQDMHGNTVSHVQLVGKYAVGIAFGSSRSGKILHLGSALHLGMSEVCSGSVEYDRVLRHACRQETCEGKG